MPRKKYHRKHMKTKVRIPKICNKKRVKSFLRKGIPLKEAIKRGC